MTTNRLPTQLFPNARANTKRRSSVPNSLVYLGAGLLLAYLTQELFDLKWVRLEAAQSAASYKMYSGILLTGYLGFQWILSICRMNGYMKQAKRLYEWHKVAGYAAPLLFYVHATSIGYGHLLLLSTVYLANCGIGFTHREYTKISSPSYHTAWLILHIVASVLTMVLVCYHIVIVALYQ